MNYAQILNNTVIQYPLYEGDIKLKFPNVSWVVGEFFPPEGYEAVQRTPMPSYDKITQNIREDAPEFVEGVWRQRWLVAPATEQDIAARTDAQARSIRSRRGEMLRECDWTQLADLSLESAQHSQWVHYRQALRDITKQNGFPWNVTWPVSPTLASAV